MTVRAFSVGTVLLLVAGCSGSRDAGFSDVQYQTEERGITRIHWNQGTEADREADAAVADLLAHGLTADSAMQIALLNNRALQAVYEDLGVAQADLVRAGLLRNPIFSAQVQLAKGGETGFTLSLVEDFLDVFYLPMRKRVAAAAFESAKLRVAGAVVDLAGQARAAFLHYQEASQMLDMRRTVLEATAASYDLAQRLRDAGNITKLDLANERALHEQAKLDVAAAEVAEAEARERVNDLLGLWGRSTSWTAAARLADPPADDAQLDDVERRAVERSLRLAEARANVQLAAERAGIAGPLALGEVEVGVTAEKDLEGTRAIGPEASIPVPVFNNGRPARDAAQAELRRAEDLYHAEAVAVRSRARTARNRLIAAHDRVRFLGEVILPLRRQVVDETQMQYNGMLASPFRLITAKQQEIEAGAQYVQAVAAYWAARLSLDQVLAGGRPVEFGSSPGSDGGATTSEGH